MATSTRPSAEEIERDEIQEEIKSQREEGYLGDGEDEEIDPEFDPELEQE